MNQNGLYLEKATSTTLGGVTVDTALSTTSTNPVQNKVIAKAIGDIDSVLSAVINGTDFDAQLTDLLGV
ncbi:MAG: hypothetical protein ACLSA6_00215 [Holdemania massiliensis]